jgi:hypothetical protein
MKAVQATSAIMLQSLSPNAITFRRTAEMTSEERVYGALVAVCRNRLQQRRNTLLQPLCNQRNQHRRCDHAFDKFNNRLQFTRNWSELYRARILNIRAVFKVNVMETRLEDVFPSRAALRAWRLLSRVRRHERPRAFPWPPSQSPIGLVKRKSHAQRSRSNRKCESRRYEVGRGFPHSQLRDLSEETRVQRPVIQRRTSRTCEALLQ